MREMAETHGPLTVEEILAHAAWLRRLAHALLGDGGGAEDAVQETLAAAMKRPPHGDRDVRPWFGRVLRNFARMQRRGEARRQGWEARAGSEPEAGPATAEELLLRHEASQAVGELLTRLREPHRSTLLLRYSEGLEPIEIARRLDLPDGTVRRRLKEGLDELRAGLERHYRDQRRDWRAALAPLALAARDRGATAAPAGGSAGWIVKGALAVNAKTLVAFAIAVLLLLPGALFFWPRPAERAPQPRRATLEETAFGTAARSPGSKPAPRSGPGAQPPLLASAGAAPDLQSCERELAELRRQRDSDVTTVVTADDARFEAMAPSPTNHRLLAPEIARILSGFQPVPDYTFDCRISRCRVSLLVAPGTDPSVWLKAIERDQGLKKMRWQGATGLGSATSGAQRMRDAFGKELDRHNLYFTVPAARPGEHPFDVGDRAPEPAIGAGGLVAAAALTVCRERVAALGKQLDDPEKAAAINEERLHERGRPGQLWNETFAAARPNPELTARFAAVVAGLRAGEDAPPAGAVECRGESDCRWTFDEPERERETLAGDLEGALKGAGWSVGGTQEEAGPLPGSGDASLVRRSILVRLSGPR
jgi:RNA polymerase sigma-70 factor (ECF subfamily)